MTSAKVTSPVLPFAFVLASVWVIVGLSMGRAQSMGLYLSPMTTALGVGRETFGLSMALSQLMMGLAAPLAGGLIDKYGAGRMVIFSVLLTILGLGAFYFATDSWYLMLGGVLMGAGVSGTGVTSLVGTIGRLAPPEKRLPAMASLGMASGVGGFLSLPLIHLLIEHFGWQGSLLWLIALTALLMPIALPISGKPPAPAAGAARQQTAKEALREAFAHPSFWFLVGGFFVCGFHVSFIMVHLPSFARDQGLPTWVGPYALSAVGIANIIGTYLAGQSGRYIEKRRGLSLIYFGRALIFAGFLVLPMTAWTVIGLCAVLGLLWLATIPLTSGLVATFFGTQWMSMLFGIVFLSHQVGAFFGVWLAGRLFDATGSYATMWWLSIGLGLLAALLNWPIEERGVARLRLTASPAGT
jgi:predicted MFS family arabinose efflux permease